MDNFDLKKYLVENKVTTNSKMLTEAKTYAVDTQADDYLDYIDKVNEYLFVIPEIQKRTLLENCDAARPPLIATVRSTR